MALRSHFGSSALASPSRRIPGSCFLFIMKGLLSACLLQWASSTSFPEMVGLNVPWKNFGYDIGSGAFDSAWFETYFAAAESNGHNIARFWVHTDGARAGLEYNSDGTVKGLSSSYNFELRSLLTIAQKHTVAYLQSFHHFEFKFFGVDQEIATTWHCNLSPELI